MTRFVNDGLVKRLLHMSGAPYYAPPAVFANTCQEAAVELMAAEKALVSLCWSAKREGYDVMVDPDGTFSLRKIADTDADRK